MAFINNQIYRANDFYFIYNDYLVQNKRSVGMCVKRAIDKLPEQYVKHCALLAITVETKSNDPFCASHRNSICFSAI